MVVAAHDLLEISSLSGSTITTAWVKPVSGSLYTFTAMVDTPDTYVGQANKIVAVNGAESDLEFIEHIPSPTIVSELSYGQSPVVGTSSNYSHGDHSHGTPAALSPATTVVSETSFGQASVVGTGSSFARHDHTHGTPPSAGISYQYFQKRGIIGSGYYNANCIIAPTGFGQQDTAANYLYAIPFVVPAGGVIDEIFMCVSAASYPGSVCRIGIYKATSKTDLYPHDLVSDCGIFTVASDPPGAFLGWQGVSGKSVLIGTADLYWFVWNANQGWRTWYIPIACCSTVLGYNAGGIPAVYTGIYVGYPYGALPATFPAGGVYITSIGSTEILYHLSS